MSITLREIKGSPLTHAELDGNFKYLMDFTNLSYVTSPDISKIFLNPLVQILGLNENPISFSMTYDDNQPYYSLVDGYYYVKLLTNFLSDFEFSVAEPSYEIVFHDKKNDKYVLLGAQTNATDFTYSLANEGLGTYIIDNSLAISDIEYFMSIPIHSNTFTYKSLTIA